MFRSIFVETVLVRDVVHGGVMICDVFCAHIRNTYEFIKLCVCVCVCIHVYTLLHMMFRSIFVKTVLVRDVVHGRVMICDGLCILCTHMKHL